MGSAIGLEKSLQNIGYQLLFADVGVIMGGKLPKQLPAHDSRALIDLDVFITKVIGGLDLTAKYRRGDYIVLADLQESVTLERALQRLKPVLPESFGEAKCVLEQIRTILADILSGKRSARDRQKVHAFCRKFLSHLHQEYAELIALQSP